MQAESASESQKLMRNRLSRRKLLQAGVVAIGAASVGLMACTEEKDAAKATREAAQAAPAFATAQPFVPGPPVGKGLVRDLAEKLWTGQTTTYQHHPFEVVDDIEEIADRTLFYKSFSNVTAFETDQGLVLIDTGSFAIPSPAAVHEAIRKWSESRLHTAVYTHGHVDHVFGVPPFAEEAKGKGWEQPRVVGHEAIAARFDRYKLTAGYNGVINSRQLGAAVDWPTSYVYPDTTYDKSTVLTVGDTSFELYHARGETDDHTWVWVPQRKVLCSGDLIIWAVPNAGNPQKVQRYCAEWVQALRKMAELNAEVLSPGHGIIVVGQDRVRQILLDTAEFLQSLHDQTVALMNEGATLDTIIHTVKPPEQLKDRPFLQTVYDEPEYVVRNIWRLYGGWYDFNPSHLKPAPEAEQGAEIAALAGGVPALIERARSLMEQGNLRLSCLVIEWAAAAEPDNRRVHELRAEVYGTRNSEETATMTKGVFGFAERESRAKAGE
ncbi:MAG: MBL fold metallo-hydrolase [Dehalococcoidia bacterium]|nr:MBL fold metallo-hydrolase [Dehalococcoidia bacterium]